MASSNPNDSISTPVPFPQPVDTAPQKSPTSPTNNTSPTEPTRRSRTSTNASISTASSRIRAASIKFMEASPPPGMWAATGTVASKAPSLVDIRRGSYSQSGWNEERQRLDRRGSESEGAIPPTGENAGERPGLGRGKRKSSAGVGAPEPFPSLEEEETHATVEENQAKETWHTPTYDGDVHSAEKDDEIGPDSKASSEPSEKEIHERKRPQKQRQYSNGYVPPPKVPWKTSTVIGLKAFWKWFLTPSGFLITIYGLNVVAWGGMLFLLLCNASPAMCKPTCNDIQSPRRKWIEVDSQILNALFCVTGFGLAPWRFRDCYWWGWWRLGSRKNGTSKTGIRRLAGIHRGWFRLPGSDVLTPEVGPSTADANDVAVPIPVDKTPDPPPTGVRAPPTSGWKMDFVVWMNAGNTFFQIVLCFFMWHYNRYKRPSWATGFFVAMGCIVAGVAGIMMFHEGKYVKKVEGVPVKKDDGSENAVEDLEAQRRAEKPSSDHTAKSARQTEKSAG